jgi:hypothetical protein
MYPLILSLETINKLKLFFECGIPRPQDVGHLRLRYCNFLTHFIISIAVLENVPPDSRFQKRATFSTLNVGLTGTGNWSSGTNRSAIHYASTPCLWSATIYLSVQMFHLQVTKVVCESSYFWKSDWFWLPITFLDSTVASSSPAYKGAATSSKHPHSWVKF